MTHAIGTAALARLQKMAKAAAERLSIGQSPTTRLSVKKTGEFQELLRKKLKVAAEVRGLAAGRLADLEELRRQVDTVMDHMGTGKLHKGIFTAMWGNEYLIVYRSLLDYIDGLADMEEQEASAMLRTINEDLSHRNNINMFMRRHSISVGLMPLGVGAIMVVALVQNRNFYVELTRSVRQELQQGVRELSDGQVLEDIMRKLKKREKRDLEYMINHLQEDIA